MHVAHAKGQAVGRWDSAPFQGGVGKLRGLNIIIENDRASSTLGSYGHHPVPNHPMTSTPARGPEEELPTRFWASFFSKKHELEFSFP